MKFYLSILCFALVSTTAMAQGKFYGGDGPESYAGATLVISLSPNSSPVVSNPIEDQQATEDQAFSFQIPAGTFSDPDEDALTYSAALSSEGVLPDWLDFNVSNRTFSGTPANEDVGTLLIEVTVEDGNGGTAEDSFELEIINSNDAPHVISEPSDLIVRAGESFNIDLSEVFDDVDVSDVLTLSVTVAESALPNWLEFNETTQMLSGATSIEEVGEYQVSITANDLAEESVSIDINLSVTVVAAISGDNDIEVYPNPFTDFISVTLPKMSGTVRLLDMNGVTKYEIRTDKMNRISVPTNQLTPGIYFLQILDRSSSHFYKVLKH